MEIGEGKSNNLLCGRLTSYSHVIYNHRAIGTPNVKVAAVGTGTSTIFHEATPSSEQFIEVAFTPSKATGKEPVQHVEQTILQQALSAFVVVVASPSAVGSWVDLLPEPHILEGSIACIGETTALDARKLGLTNYLLLCKNLRADAYDH
uniref:Uroporphyrinogen-III synthase n=1 Tax=Lactuca sativa TaxID=4236 RepID=A0A9R1XW81_LACSA|nr:hypothetical protein LSAT_V11C200066540 [Lactuca sativa]